MKLRGPTMRRSIALLAGAALLGLGAAIVLLHPRLPVMCSDSRRLDRILGGGLPVCLGKDGSQLDRYPNENDDRSSCALVKRSPDGEYWYGAQHDDPLCRHSGPVVSGCVTLANGVTAPAVARSATARMGGSWRLALARTPLGAPEQIWSSSDGFEVSQAVSFDGVRTVCVRD